MAMTAKNHCALKPAQREPETTFMVRDTKETKPKDEAITLISPAFTSAPASAPLVIRSTIFGAALNSQEFAFAATAH